MNSSNIPELSSTDNVVENENDTKVFDVNDAKKVMIAGMSKNILDFYVYAMDVQCLPESVALDLTTRMEQSIKSMNESILNLVNSDVSQQSIPEILNNVLTDIPPMDLSKQQVLGHLQNSWNFNSPTEVQCSNGDSFSYIPISHYIKNYFENDSAKFEENDVFSQSCYYKQHIQPAKDAKDKNVHVLLYSDEFEICNPIGVSKNKYKLLAVYYRILNFHGKHTSLERNNHLLLLAKASTVKSVGIDEIFSPLIKELNDLYFDGIPLGENMCHVIACFMAGDNLSNNLICGFITCFARTNFCRYCTVHSNNAFETFFSSNFHLRTHIDIEESAMDQSEGVKQLSPFLDLPYVKLPHFFPVDVTHDVFEGVSHLVLSTVIGEMLKRNLITL